MPPYLVLLQVGFTMPPALAGAVRSYRTFSPLPIPGAAGDVAGGSVYRRFVFCGTFRGLSPPRRYLAPCPVEPGLSSATHAVNVTAAAAQPTHGGSVGFAAGSFNPRDPHG